MLLAFGKNATPACFIMPARMAATEALGLAIPPSIMLRADEVIE